MRFLNPTDYNPRVVGIRYLTKRDISLPKRAADSHKGQNGRVLIVGGSLEYTGAVLLAGLAAFRSGVDNVTVAAPEKVAWALNTMSPDLITVKFKGERFLAKHAAKVARLAKDFDAVLLGNGLSRHLSTMEFVRKLLSSAKGKQVWVVDADALRAIRGPDTAVKRAILTPHKDELRAMLKNAGIELSLSGKPEKDADTLQKALKPLLTDDTVLLLKGKVDSILSASKIVFNSTGNAGMTVGGTGDVLAGLCAGLASQMRSPFSAACAAAYINGALGDRLHKSMGNGYIASDLVNLIPGFLKDF